MKTLLILAVFALIVYNLGAGLYYMIADRDGSARMVNALTWRIGLSVGLIVVVLIGIATGLIVPHGGPN